MLVWIREGDICLDGRGSQSGLRREESFHPSKLISAKAAVLRVVCWLYVSEVYIYVSVLARWYLQVEVSEYLLCYPIPPTPASCLLLGLQMVLKLCDSLCW